MAAKKWEERESPPHLPVKMVTRLDKPFVSD